MVITIRRDSCIKILMGRSYSSLFQRINFMYLREEILENNIIQQNYLIIISTHMKRVNIKLRNVLNAL